MKKILVLGATGKVGSEMVKQLSDRGIEVLAATRNPENYQAQKNVKPVRFNYGDNSNLDEIFAGVEAAFLMSAPLDPDAFAHLKPVIDKVKEKGVGKIVLLSALGVDQNDQAPLRQIEKYIEGSDINYTFLRPNFFMDNFYPGWIYNSIKSSGVFYIPAEKEKTSFIAVSDIALAGVTALLNEGHAGKAYNLTGSESLNHDEVAEIISKYSSKPIKYVSISDDDMRKAMKEMGVGAGQIEYMSALYMAVRKGYTEAVDPMLEKLINKKSKTFDEWANENAEHF